MTGGDPAEGVTDVAVALAAPCPAAAPGSAAATAAAAGAGGSGLLHSRPARRRPRRPQSPLGPLTGKSLRNWSWVVTGRWRTLRRTALSGRLLLLRYESRLLRRRWMNARAAAGAAEPPRDRMQRCGGVSTWEQPRSATGPGRQQSSRGRTTPKLQTAAVICGGWPESVRRSPWGSGWSCCPRRMPDWSGGRRRRERGCRRRRRRRSFLRLPRPPRRRRKPRHRLRPRPPPRGAPFPRRRLRRPPPPPGGTWRRCGRR